MHQEKTFSKFLRTAAVRKCFSEAPNMYSRMLDADIKSLSALLRWTRERYPTQYRLHSMILGARGTSLVLWAQYLAWKEGFSA